MNTKNTKKFEFKPQKLISYGIWLLIIILGFSTAQNASNVFQTRREIQAEKDKVAKMQAQNNELEKQLTESQSATFIEKQVRDRLGLVMPDEAIVVLPDEDTLRKLAPQSIAENDILPAPNWEKWEKLFF